MLRKKIYTYLQLIRFPNIFTSLADSSAGYLIVADTIDISIIICLSLVSAGIYAAGCVLNDYCDIEKDRRERPERPIPSGRASRIEAMFLFCALSIVSLLFSACVSIRALITALILILLVIIFSSITKERPISGPVNMALCRSLNLYLGMSVVSQVPMPGLIFLVVTFLYVLALTVLSDYEMSGAPGKKIWFVSSGLILVVCSLGFLVIIDILKIDSLLFVFLLVFFTGPTFIKLIKNIGPLMIGKAIKYLVLGIPLLDAVYVAGVQSWSYAIPVAMCTLMSILIARFFYVT